MEIIFVDDGSADNTQAQIKKWSAAHPVRLIVRAGKSGLAITWKSSCGGYAYTTLDGKDEAASFTCP